MQSLWAMGLFNACLWIYVENMFEKFHPGFRSAIKIDGNFGRTSNNMTFTNVKTAVDNMKRSLLYDSWRNKKY